MLLEKRTRVEIFLPSGSDLLLTRIVTEWLAEELTYARGGSTLTSPFLGLYLSNTLGEIVRDKVQILFCDFQFNLENKDQYLELATYLHHLRLFVRKALKEEEIWITCHPILRAA